MTQVEFHTGVADPLHFACRLLRKAYRQGARLVVCGAPQTLAALDRELWVFEAQDFVPHRRLAPGQAPDAAAGRTPIWLVDGEPPQGAPPILVNVGGESPQRPQRYSRIIEIVAADGDETRRARARWRAYESAGLPIKHHPAAGRGAEPTRATPS
jgi:DNA polymerase-3 subunit chi